MRHRPHEPQTVGQCIGMINRFARRHVAMLLAPLDLPEVAFPLLMRLSMCDAVSQDELAEMHLIDKSTVARALVRMEDVGLVTRSVDDEDRRVKRVQITEDGTGFAHLVREALDRWDEDLMEGLADAEKQDAVRYLRHIAGNAHKHWDALVDDPPVGLTPPGE